MRPNNLLFILTISIALFGCQAKDNQVPLNESLSVELPRGFILEETEATGMKIHKARYKGQHIICSSASLSNSDTLTAEALTSILQLNTEKYIESFAGEEIFINGIKVSNAEALEFSFICSRNEGRYQVFGRSLIHSDHMYFLTYEAPYPVESNIEKSINRFFKSVQLYWHEQSSKADRKRQLTLTAVLFII